MKEEGISQKGKRGDDKGFRPRKEGLSFWKKFKGVLEKKKGGFLGGKGGAKRPFATKNVYLFLTRLGRRELLVGLLKKGELPFSS